MADTAKIRKAALEALAMLEHDDISVKALRERLEFIAENAKRKRTEADRARDRRRSRQGADPKKIAEMKARMEKMDG